MSDAGSAAAQPTPCESDGFGPPFSCSIHRRDDTVVLTVAGELDIATIEEFDTSVGEALDTEMPRVLVDLGGLTFIDSTGVRAVLQLHRQQSPSQQLEFLPGPPAVQRVFEIAGLLTELPFQDASGA